MGKHCMETVKWNSRMGINTLVNFTMECYMGMENWNGQMGLFIKAISITTGSKGKENIYSKMGVNTKGKW